MAEHLTNPAVHGRAVLEERSCIILAYAVSFGLMLFCSGLYQDDWTLYNMEPATISAIFHDQGHRWLAYFHNFLLSFDNAVYLYRSLIFTAYLSCALILYEIIKKLGFAGAGERVFLVLFFAVFPVNNVRFLLINAPYAVCSFTFWVAFWTMIRCKETSGSKSVRFRAVSLIAFLIAFDTNSLLVFYILPLIYLLKACFFRDNVFHMPDMVIFMKTVSRNLDFVLLPLVYWLPKTLLFPPGGAWEGYNQITAASLAMSPLFLVRSFQTSFFSVIDYSFRSFGSASIALSALIAVALWHRHRSYAGFPSGPSRQDSRFLCLGIFIFCLAVLPYNLVGLLPKLENWHSRHQLLVPLGASLLLVYGVRTLGRMLHIGAFARMFVMCLLLCQFIATNVGDCVGLHLDWFRQQALIIHMQEISLFATGRTFIFDDQAQPADMIKRNYPVYQYAGMMKRVFGDQKRIGLDSTQLTSNNYIREIKRQKKYFTPLWNAGKYVPAPPDWLIIVEPGFSPADRLSKMLSLKFYEFYDPAVFRETLKNTISLRIVKL